MPKYDGGGFSSLQKNETNDYPEIHGDRNMAIGLYRTNPCSVKPAPRLLLRRGIFIPATNSLAMLTPGTSEML